MRKEIQKCSEALKQGKIILYPTDTIWGIGCDATNTNAVEKIYTIKKRVDSKAMLVLVDSIEMVASYVEEIPDIALKLLEVNEQPLTIVYPGAYGLADNLVADDGSVGIRISREPFSMGLIKAFGKPIVSSSANLAGQPNPAYFSEISEDIISGMDYVVYWMREDRKKRKPSGILKVHLNGEIEVIRQ
ncbi:L-threonylcarbamoyladenylate synthase [Bacteroidota bacterium]